ncbi:predicted protein [Naegleria gruberi]|uniref:Predicted protein n=1 Tax=Naegleria gruberi TaxID=5762 RepID=D2VZ13_NAEGR|nr:uncharacterized protein NAEGRDRAFT_74318 [Naegleria gruberi]EFC37864.1 predicted protein [Naegleria gruberi]|eukprot:XP_002670608.1 predicted protein [Naegleria gruberi strain NEG-M]
MSGISIVRLGLKKTSSSSIFVNSGKNLLCQKNHQFTSRRQYGILSNIASKVLTNIKIPKLVSTENIDSIITSSDMIIDESVAKGTLAHLIQETILKDRELHNQSSDPNRTSKTISLQVDGDLKLIGEEILDSVKSDHPVLDAAAKYFFNTPGKLFRPMLVLMTGRAVNEQTEISDLETIMRKQRKLAETTELIHVASLIHDDIVDDADTRRGIPALNKNVGNKVAVLAGDFLLGRASINLARIGNIESIDLISTVIEHLAYGEVLQMAGKGKLDFDYYMKTIFFKTSSLIANSCKASAVLSGSTNRELIDAAYTFGKHVGIAYQLTDDSLDFTQSQNDLGKPSQGADMKLGLTTCPIIFAAQAFPEQMKPIIDRKFSGEGDIEMARNFVIKSNAVQSTKDLADTHTRMAYDAVMKFKPSPVRSVLLELLYKISLRNK